MVNHPQRTSEGVHGEKRIKGQVHVKSGSFWREQDSVLREVLLAKISPEDEDYLISRARR